MNSTEPAFITLDLAKAEEAFAQIVCGEKTLDEWDSRTGERVRILKSAACGRW